MCFAFDARPPDLPADLVHPRMAGGAGAETLELTSADGTVFSAALAESADGARGPGVVILPDVRGLYRFYIELAERFAAGRPSRDRDRLLRPHGGHWRSATSDFEYMPHVEQTLLSQIQADADAAPGGARRADRRDELRDGRLLLRRHAVVPGRDEPRARRSTARSASTARWTRRARFGMPTPLDHVGETRVPGARPLRRRRPGDPDERRRRLRPAPRGGRRRARDRRLPRRAALVLRPLASTEHEGACSDAWRRVVGFLEKVGAARTA